jgi:hypothetical protein
MSNIEAREGCLDDVIGINEKINEWDSRFTREQYEQFLAGKTHLIVIGIAEDKPAGFSICWVNHENNTLNRWVSGVAPEYRKRGVYKTICDFYENWAKDMGLEKVMSDVASRRPEMIMANIKLGYKFLSIELGEDMANSRLFFEKAL